MEIAALIVSLVVLFVAIVLLWRSRQPASKVDINQTIGELRQEINAMRAQMNNDLGNVGTIAGNMLRAQMATSDRLTRLEQSAEHIAEVGKNISSLQDILKPPTFRGVLGETLLENLLAQYLPRDTFEMQHRFKSGLIVDAVVHLPAGMVPVDAKFPLDNFRKMLESDDEKLRKQYRREFTRDVKNRIDEIATKYILPDEGTLNFALLYVPAENVYYEITVKGDTEGNIVDYALSSRVVPVSPNTLYAYLQAIAIGLKGLRVEKFAEEILFNLSRLKGDLESFHKDFQVLGKHINDAGTKYNAAEKRLNRFEDKMFSLDVHDGGTETLDEGMTSYLPSHEPGAEEGDRDGDE
jgi:DNA recombination protein RmuC